MTLLGRSFFGLDFDADGVGLPELLGLLVALGDADGDGLLDWVGLADGDAEVAVGLGLALVADGAGRDEAGGSGGGGSCGPHPVMATMLTASTAGAVRCFGTGGTLPLCTVDHLDRRRCRAGGVRGVIGEVR